MTEYVLPSVNASEIYEEITRGKGYVVVPQAFSKPDIDHARELIHFLIRKQGKRVSHFQGANDSKLELQARVWNLLNKVNRYVEGRFVHREHEPHKSINAVQKCKIIFGDQINEPLSNPQ